VCAYISLALHNIKGAVLDIRGIIIAIFLLPLAAFITDGYLKKNNLAFSLDIIDG